ncbi:MAG: glycogen synthase GlgA, partial [Oscillospiraceae bacterium]|nr:glycogen synthase GlgA [Oscillospiraceae bacterium]
MNILFTASEAQPYVASGGLADVIGSLPKAINRKGNDCRVVIPLYKSISEKFRNEIKFLTTITVDVSWRKQYCGIFTTERDGVTYYFLDNEYYFFRDGIYGFHDDCERFVFFSRAVLEMLKYIDFKPDIINSNDWHTAMIPVYYQIFYKYQQEYSNIKNVFTIHNIQYQGKYGREVVNDLMGIPMYHFSLLEYDGCVNMMKGAIETADKIVTVSPSYAWEILDSWYSYGLDRILVHKKDKIIGILNGIDSDLWNPLNDPLIASGYSSVNIGGKKNCREALLSEIQISEDESPIIGIVTRFVSHKGIDLIKYAFEELVNDGFKFAVLGSGEKIYEDFFVEMAKRFPERVFVKTGFDTPLAKRIYAGADMFLMPSQSEPCGLAQMFAMRYGTIPIVRETGGLRDTVKDNGNKDGNGFTFKTYNALDMVDALHRAMKIYEDKKEWKNLIKRAMECDFSWDSSAD